MARDSGPGEWDESEGLVLRVGSWRMSPSQQGHADRRAPQRRSRLMAKDVSWTGTMAINGTSAELDYARRRASAGLWIGPGFLAIASIAATMLASLWAPGNKDAVRPLIAIVMVFSAVLHLGCFFEFIIVVKYLGHRPIPLAVLMLVGYWILLAGIVVVSACAS